MGTAQSPANELYRADNLRTQSRIHQPQVLRARHLGAAAQDRDGPDPVRPVRGDDDFADPVEREQLRRGETFRLSRGDGGELGFPPGSYASSPGAEG